MGKLIEQKQVNADAIAIEHYENVFYNNPTFDIVSLENGNPKWNKIQITNASLMCDVDESILLPPLSENKKLMLEVERLRLDIDPNIDKPYVESEEILKRREAINKEKILKNQIQKLIDMKATERELQELLKSDLSIFGERYSYPSDEYVCFSEFPLNSGFVDFVVAGGRSRMDVYLIEIKGADFNFITESSYHNLSVKIYEAYQQVLRRLGDIEREYSSFCKLIHEKRLEVEKGNKIHNGLLGPKGALSVDPNKDICLYGILIGGRSIDDSLESKLRHNLEKQHHHKIKIDSWDSWLRKVNR